MSNTLKIMSIVCLTCFAIIQAAAQNNTRDSLKTASIKLLIPELHVLIDSALVNNGMFNYRKLEIEAKEYNLKSKRQDWTRNFGIQADTRYGTFDNYSSSIEGQSSSIITTRNNQFNYGVGFYMKLPIFDVINRKAKVKRAKTEVEQAKKMAKFQEDELKEVVIRYYEDLILKQQLLELRASNLGNARVNMEMVETEFRNGLIPISEYVRISDMTSRIAAEYENAKSDFLVSKKVLENITKVEIN